MQADVDQKLNGMKILLITPPTKYVTPVVEPKLVMKDVGLYPPLGLMYIAAYIERHTDHNVKILDAVAEGLDYEGIKAYVLDFAPDVVGIQAITQILVDVVRVVNIVKDVDKNTHVCIGGPHAYIYPKETAMLPGVDSVIPGEGELVFTELVNSLEKGKGLEGIGGIVYKENGSLKENDGTKWIQELDSLPLPARHMVPKGKYYCIIETDSPMTTMISTRGCPYNCSFCLGFERGRYRERSVEKVVDELESCVRDGYRDIFFWDSIFTVKKDRVLKICQEIINRNVQVSWSVRARINHVDEEMLEKLREAGCKRIQYGIEAGSDETLKLMRKGTTTEQIQRDIRLTKQFGFTVYGDFMIGFPGESRQNILDTIDFACNLDLDYVNFALTTPYPDTPLYKWGFEKKLYTTDYWRDFAKDPKEGFVPKIWDESVSREELNGLLALAYRRFYLRPGYIWRRLIEVRSYNDFMRKARTGLRMLNKKMLEV